MSLQNTDRFRYLYLGLKPPYPYPADKPTYTSYNAKEEELDGFCQECDIESNFLTATRPYIGPYHHKISERFTDGMPPRMYNYTGQQKCSQQLHNEWVQQRVEQNLRKYGLYWEVPWQKYKTKHMYVDLTRELSPHERNPLNLHYGSTDKVSSTLLITEKGCVRNVPGICDLSSRRLRTAFYEDTYPNSIHERHFKSNFEIVMWPKLKSERLEPDELCKPVDWEKHDGYEMYAFYPPVTYQYPRGLLLYTKTELEKMQTTCRTHVKTKIPEDTAIFTPHTMWPPPLECKMKLNADMQKEISAMAYEDIREKYPNVCNAPAKPFVEKRLHPSDPNSWECDYTKGQTDDQILATLGHPMVVSRDGKQWRPCKFPALHSDGYHVIHPSWYYQPSTYVKYVNESVATCNFVGKKKSWKAPM
uniref:Uncharacterized protein n=1 Tax=Strigamia maritima TaxID=126957 RepID=T1IMB8_STRMM